MKILVDVPDGWKGPYDCVGCGRYRHFCNERFKNRECPYANAVKAVEVKQDLSGFGYANGDDIYNENGKPVRLFAVEDK